MSSSIKTDGNQLVTDGDPFLFLSLLFTPHLEVKRQVAHLISAITPRGL